MTGDVSDADSARADTLRRALTTISDLRRQLSEARGAVDEPVAIIGLACRLPGGGGLGGGDADTEAFWRMLVAGESGIVDIPGDRWDVEEFYDPRPGTPGRTTARRLGLVTDLDAFDHAYFGISREEGVDLDPQQRLALEVSWTALEDAGMRRDELEESPTGVYAAVSSYDFALSRNRNADRLTRYSSLGMAHGPVAGRVSHAFGLQGPCVSLDTACSSSLVAVHLAAQALRSRECDLAVAGGVNAVVSPGTSVAFSQAGMVSSANVSRPFDEETDGPVIGEGCAFLVLKRLRDARRDGDRVRAVLIGSAVNHNGRSTGLSAPSVSAQTAVITRALGRAGVDQEDVGYVEAHASGTRFGDEMEIAALGEAMLPRETRLLVGSGKGHIGHLQAAGGAAALVKVVLSLEHEVLPATLNLVTPNSDLPLRAGRLELLRETTSWPRGDRRRVAGVSTFGFSGTNCHVLIAEADPVVASRAPECDEPMVLAISGRDRPGLRRSAAALAEHLEHLEDGQPTPTWSDVVSSWNSRRTHDDHRRGLVVRGSVDAAARLRAVADDEGAAPGGHGAAGVALLCGHGGLPPDVERILRRSAAGAAQLTAVTALAGPDRGPGPTGGRGLAGGGLLGGPAGPGPTSQVLLSYTALRTLLDWGVRPAALLGWGAGEVVAAALAEALDPADVARMTAPDPLVGTSGRDGVLVALTGGPIPAELLVGEGEGDRPSIAADLGTAGGFAVVPADASSRFREHAAGCGLHTAEVGHPGAPWTAVHTESVPAVPPAWPWVSTVTGGVWPWRAAPDDAHWERLHRSPAKVAQALSELPELGVGTLIAVGAEFDPLGPLGILCADLGVVLRCVPGTGADPQMAWMEALAACYDAGEHLDWTQAHPMRGPVPASLPTYRYDRATRLPIR